MKKTQRSWNSSLAPGAGLKRIGAKTLKWMRFRKKFLESRQTWTGDWLCTNCGTPTRHPDIDHIKKRSTHPHLMYEESNLQVLCRGCHSKKSLAQQ